MVTKVGLQSTFASALKDLLELDYDAIEAYNAAIERLENENFKKTLTNFRDDHVQHTKNITALLKKHDEDAPTGPSGKQWLTKGKVILSNLLGDKAILFAMITNEIDTNTAYERLNYHDDLWPDARDFLRKGLEDEHKHKNWLQSAVRDM